MLSQPQPSVVTPTDGSTQANITEADWIEKQAKLIRLNSECRFRDLLPIPNPNTLVENDVGDLFSFVFYTTHVLPPNDSRVSGFKDATIEEDENLEKREVLKSEKTPLRKRKDLNIFRSRYVHAIKNVRTPEEKRKSRLVL